MRNHRIATAKRPSRRIFFATDMQTIKAEGAPEDAFAKTNLFEGST